MRPMEVDTGPPTWSRSRRLPTGIVTPSLLLALTVFLVAGTRPSVAALPPAAMLAGPGQPHYADHWTGQHYTDQWAVRVDGSDDDARHLAERHGFIYVDKVGTNNLFG